MIRKHMIALTIEINIDLPLKLSKLGVMASKKDSSEDFLMRLTMYPNKANQKRPVMIGNNPDEQNSYSL